MEKIFDPKVEEYLKETGVSQKDINRIKLEKAKEGVVNILHAIITHINDEQFGSISKFVSDSPAGDGMGTDKTFIDFACVVGEVSDKYGVDITEVCKYMKELKITNSKTETK